jgi:hypothetical protein
MITLAVWSPVRIPLVIETVLVHHQLLSLIESSEHELSQDSILLVHTILCLLISRGVILYVLMRTIHHNVALWVGVNVDPLQSDVSLVIGDIRVNAGSGQRDVQVHKGVLLGVVRDQCISPILGFILDLTVVLNCVLITRHDHSLSLSEVDEVCRTTIVQTETVGVLVAG